MGMNQQSVPEASLELSPRSTTSTLSAQSSFLPWSLLVTAVVLAVTSRVLIAFAGLPSAINFLHFPLLFAAYVLSRSRVREAPIGTMERVLVVSAALTVASLIGSQQSSWLRTLLLWPILIEPILVILTIWHLSAAGFPSTMSLRLGRVVVLGQLPIAIAQAASSGMGDAVQGTLIRQGAGHHVLGAMGLMAALVALASILTGRRPPLSLTGVAVAGGFLLAVLTDMKQGIAVFFLVGTFVLVSGLKERRRIRGFGQGMRRTRLAVAVVIGIAVSVILILNLFVILAREPWRFGAPFEAKAASLERISQEMDRNPMAYLVGLGPGTTATRIAWLSAPSAPQSSLQGLGLEPTPVATELSLEWANNPRWLQSSVSSPFSSWVGVYGDLGLLGLAALVVLWWLPWRAARHSPEGLGARAVILFTVLLGLIFNWMEEPVLVITAAVLIGGLSAPSETARAGFRGDGSVRRAGTHHRFTGRIPSPNHVTRWDRQT